MEIQQSIKSEDCLHILLRIIERILEQDKVKKSAEQLIQTLNISKIEFENRLLSNVVHFIYEIFHQIHSSIIENQTKGDNLVEKYDVIEFIQAFKGNLELENRLIESDIIQFLIEKSDKKVLKSISEKLYDLANTSNIHHKMSDVYEEILNYGIIYVTNENIGLIELNVGRKYYLTINYLQNLTKIQQNSLHTLLKRNKRKKINFTRVPRPIEDILQSICNHENHKKLTEVTTSYWSTNSFALIDQSKRRKQQGSYYTQTSLIRPLLTKTFDPLIEKCLTSDDILNIKVVDPSMGTGNFLLPALDYLAESLERKLREEDKIDNEGESNRGLAIHQHCIQLILENCIYGIDLDEGAIQQAKYRFSMVASIDIDKCNFVVADSLKSDWNSLFPNVFNRKNPGFDVIIGNPPWEVIKPNSKEFFTRLDPLYRTYSKQEGKKIQKYLLNQFPQIRQQWINIQDGYKSLSKSFTKNRINEAVIPYNFQGNGDLNNYKLFTELSFIKLRKGGRCGIVIPSGIGSDAGTKPLRELLFFNCKWEWFFCFINHREIFPIHRSFKFSCIVFEKGSTTNEIFCSFMNEDLVNWQDPSDVISLSLDDIKRFSPKELFFPEVNSVHELQLLRKIYSNIYRIHDLIEMKKIEYKREFDFTNKSSLLISSNLLNFNEYSSKDREDFGILINEKEILLPVYQGSNLYIGNFAYQNYISGAGNQARFNKTNESRKIFYPQFFMNLKIARNSVPPSWNSFKLGFRHVTNSTNTRSMISSIIPNFPAINAVPVLRMNMELTEVLFSAAITNSLIFDYSLRKQLSGTNLTLHLLSNQIFSKKIPDAWTENFISRFLTMYLNWVANAPIFAGLWMQFINKFGPNVIPIKFWALTPWERKRIEVILNCVIFNLFEISINDLDTILSNNKSDQKGLWKIEKKLVKEIRLPNVCRMAYTDLYGKPLSEYLEWDFSPEIGERYLGRRYLDWQIGLSPIDAKSQLKEYYNRLELIFGQS